MMTLFTAIGLCMYELAQVWIPNRTFDWSDVGATVAGGLAALLLGGGFFLVPCGTAAKPPAPPHSDAR